MNPVEFDYKVWKILQKKVFKTLVTDLDELKQRLRTDWPSWIMSSLRQPFVSGIVDRSRSMMRALAIFLHTVINWIQIWRIWRPQLR